MRLTDLFEENLPSFGSDTIKTENGKILPNQFPNKVKNFNCEDIPNLTSLENSPLEVNNFYCSTTSITSLKGAPKIVNDSFFCNNTKITSLEYAPLKCAYFSFFGTKVKSLQGIGKQYLKECTQIYLSDSIESNILGLCLVNKLIGIHIFNNGADTIKVGPLYEAIEIVNKHLGTDGDECMEELIQKGYKNYAKF